MGEINQQDEAEEKEEDGSNQRKVVAPDDEEAVRNEEGDDNKSDPGNKLRSPKAILQSRPLVPCAVNAYEEESHDEVEEAKGEVDALNGDEASACSSITGDGSVVQEGVLELFDRPISEHYP